MRNGSDVRLAVTYLLHVAHSCPCANYQQGELLQCSPLQCSTISCFAVLNAAARLITDTQLSLKLSEHITPVLHGTLHWLPIAQRIEYKITLVTYSCVCGTSAAYFHDILLRAS